MAKLSDAQRRFMLNFKAGAENVRLNGDGSVDPFPHELRTVRSLVYLGILEWDKVGRRTAASVILREELLPCPFCGGPVNLEEARDSYDDLYGYRRWWGVVCRNTINLGGSCAIGQRPSASIRAAVKRWNMRNGVRAKGEFE